MQSSPPAAKTGVRSEEEKRKEFISPQHFGSRCLAEKIWCSFLRPCESPCLLCGYFIQNCNLLRLAPVFLQDFSSWMAVCNLPWNWPPDTCTSWSGAFFYRLLLFWMYWSLLYSLCATYEIARSNLTFHCRPFLRDLSLFFSSARSTYTSEHFAL